MKNICDQCHAEIIKGDGIGTCYGVDKAGRKICYQCCGKNDAENLRELPIGGRAVLYVDPEAGLVMNWPCTLKIKAYGFKSSWHNFAGRNGRVDFWFRFAGVEFHGVNIGDSQIAHCRKLKG